MPRADLTRQARRAMDARAGYARQDMGFGLASFVRPVVRGKRMYVEGVKQAWMGGLLTISGPELDAADLGVLLALLVLALGRFQECTSAPGCEVPGLLPDAAEHRQGTNCAEKHQALSLKTTMAAICRELGRDPDNGRAHASVRASLRRLSSIVIEAQAGESWAQTHLLLGAAGRGRRAVEVVLSYRLTWAILGNGPHTLVNIGTWRRLSPVAQVLYHWLCSWRPGHGGCPPIKLDTLATHVWGGTCDSLTRRRRQQIKAALAELPTSEWAVETTGTGAAACARITRTRVLEYANPCS
jgi:Replication protein C (RepC).